MLKMDYQIRLDSPVHVGVGYGYASFLDMVVVRDNRDHPYLPGSTIKGKARAASRRLAQRLGLEVPCLVGEPCGLKQGGPCPVCRLFGSPQYPGQLHFDNVQLPEEYHKLLNALTEQQQNRLLSRRSIGETRTNVTLSRRRRAAQPDHLFSYESLRTDLPFTGQIVGEVTGREGGSAGVLKEDLALLWSALKLVTHLGKARSRGLGRCSIEVVGVEVAGQPFSRGDYEAALRSLLEEVQP